MTAPQLEGATPDFDFDWTEQWFVQNDGFGASRIVAKDVDREFARELIATLDRLRRIEEAALAVVAAWKQPMKDYWRSNQSAEDALVGHMGPPLAALRAALDPQEAER